ncbi:NAD(P)H-binding protein [Dactylosporangium sp. NPDC051541]|uniref:NAD(P)H-binding protein n=1 Tax=Dactylosporangium sp. NPDC051541 TaxID=3363977 RepID=UPI0037B11E1F
MPTDQLIAVTGASGALGRLVVNRLLNLVPAERIIAVVRDPAKVADLAARGVTVRTGDYDRPQSLDLQGVDRLLLISSPELDADKRTGQHRNVIEAAADVRLLVYTSFLTPDGAHQATEAAIRAGGRAYTFLRNPFYTDAFVQTGDHLASGTGGGALNTATRANLAEAAAAVLTGEAHHHNRAYDLTGPLWTFPGVAEAIGVPYREEAPAGAMGFLHGLAKAGRLERQTDDLETLLGRPPTTAVEAFRAARR